MIEAATAAVVDRGWEDPALDVPGAPAVLDWDATLAFREHLFFHGMGVAEAMDFADESFDLVVSCLSLIDIEHADQAIAEMARVLKPGGTLLVEIGRAHV